MDQRHAVILQPFGDRVTLVLARFSEARTVLDRLGVVAVDGFSVHADADELLAWIGSAPQPPEVVYVVHGEPAASATLAERVRDELGLLAVVPSDGEKVTLRGEPQRRPS